MNIRRLRLLLVLGLMACEEGDPDVTRERGDLGRGKFIYECLGQTDAACEQGPAEFPQAIAVDARFWMRFAVERGPTPAVIPAAQTFVQAHGGFTALRAGELALLAVNGNLEVIDIKHVRSAQVSEVRVQREGSLPQSELELNTGESVELRAVPFDALGVPLAGALDYTWSSKDHAALKVETLPDLNRVLVRALRAGDTSLEVVVGKHALSLPVHVQGADVEEDAGSDAGEDAGDLAPDAGADTGDDAGRESDGGNV